MEVDLFVVLATVLFTTGSSNSIDGQRFLEHLDSDLRWRTGSTVAPFLRIQIMNRQVAVKNLFRTEAAPELHYLADRVEKEGDDAHFYCKLDGANGREQMSWKREGDTKPLLEGTQPFDERIQVQKQRHGVIELTISDLKPEDTRNYTCIVKLDSGRVVTKTRLLVIEYKTRFSSRQHMLMKYHSIGGSTSISCHADGHPVPLYRWYKDGVQLSDNSTFSIVDTGGKSTLKILTLANDDDAQWIFGTYSCKATNMHGSAMMQYKLHAAAIPDKTENITIKTTRSTYIELGVAAPGDTGGLPITGYRVRWMEEVEESKTGGGGGGEGGVEGEGGGFGEAGGIGVEGGQARSVVSQVFNVGDPIVIPGLDPGKKYVFEVAAMNEAGVGKTVFRNIQTPQSDEDVGAVLYSSSSSGLFPLWIFLAILFFFILLILLALLLWCCGYLTTSALICCPCCANYFPDCLGCCSTLCWCLPLMNCCVCCGRTYRGSSYDVMRKKKIPLCVCCPTDGVAVSSKVMNKIRLLTLQRNEKAEVGVNSAFSTAAKVGAGSVGVNSTDGYARGYYLHKDYKGKSDTMTTRKTDTMTSRKSDTTKDMVFSYDTESSYSSERAHGVNTMETQTSGNNFTVNSRYIGRDNHVTRDVFLDRSGKEVKMYRYPEGQDSIQTYSLASDWNRTRSKERLARSYDDELDVSEPVLKRISKRDERYASQPMGEHLSRRDSVTRDRKRRSSVEVITFYQPGEQMPATRDAKIQIYTNDDDYGSLPRMKLAQLYHDTRIDLDRHLRSSSIPRNVKLSAMVDMGDPTAVDYDLGTATYTEVRRKKDMSKYATAPVIRRAPRYTTDEATQTFRRSKYENEFDVPLERVRPSREPSLQRNPTEPPDPETEYSEVHTQKTLHIRPQQEVQEVIYRPISIETKETNTMTERPKRWSRPPTPPHAAPSGTSYRTFPIEMEKTPSNHKPGHRRPPAKPHRSKPQDDVEEPIQCTVRPNVESGQPFDFDALDHLESANIETQTDFPLDADSITKESHGRWPEEPPLQAMEPNQQDHWPEEPPVQISSRDTAQRGRRPEEGQPQVIRPEQRGQSPEENPSPASLQDTVQKGRLPDEVQPEKVPYMLAPGPERGAPLYRSQHGQEVVEETLVRRSRSIEFLESMDQSEVFHQYAVGPEVIFVDSGNYSMEEPHRAEPEHHLAVSPPETHDYFEETETFETTEITEKAITEVKSYETRTETKTQVMEVQSSQSAFQDYTPDGPCGGVQFGDHGSSSATMSRVGGPQGGEEYSYQEKQSTFQEYTSGEPGGGALFGDQGSTTATMSRVGGAQGGAGHGYQEKQIAYGGYSVQGAHGTDGRAFLTVERQDTRTSPSNDSRNEKRSYWRV